MKRIDLVEASATYYDALHDAMKRAGFARDLSTGGGVRFQLPMGSYAYVGSQTTSRVLPLAKSALATLGRDGAILIVEAKSVAWDGLTTL
ncbi:MAG: hypothetical protein ABJD07_02830 [Gemmatimonadaceae bacterium]